MSHLPFPFLSEFPSVCFSEHCHFIIKLLFIQLAPLQSDLALGVSDQVFQHSRPVLDFSDLFAQ